MFPHSAPIMRLCVVADTRPLAAQPVHGEVQVQVEGQEPDVHQTDPLHTRQLHQVSGR